MIRERADGTWEGLPKGCRVEKVRRWETTYGSFHGGDPRHFYPDPDAASTEERQAHHAACEAWDKAEKQGKPGPDAEHGGCEWKALEDGTVLKMQRSGAFGLGTYQIEVEALEVTYQDGSVRVFM